MKNWIDTVKENSEKATQRYKNNVINIMKKMGAEQSEIDQISDVAIGNAIRSNMDPVKCAYIMLQ